MAARKPEAEKTAPELEGVEIKFSIPPPGMEAPKPTPSADGVIQLPVKVRVERSIKFKKDASTPAEESSSGNNDIIEVHKFATTPASVYVGIDMKKTKDYNSAGIMFGVTYPCYAEEIPAAMERAYEIIMERLRVELPRIVNAVYELRDARIAEREPK